MRAKVRRAIESCRAHLQAGWQVWESVSGTRWARVKQSHWQTEQIETEPMTADEKAVVDDVIREQSNEQADQSDQAP